MDEGSSPTCQSHDQAPARHPHPRRDRPHHPSHRASALHSLVPSSSCPSSHCRYCARCGGHIGIQHLKAELGFCAVLHIHSRRLNCLMRGDDSGASPRLDLLQCATERPSAGDGVPAAALRLPLRRVLPKGNPSVPCAGLWLPAKQRQASADHLAEGVEGGDRGRDRTHTATVPVPALSCTNDCGRHDTNVQLSSRNRIGRAVPSSHPQQLLSAAGRRAISLSRAIDVFRPCPA